MKSTQKAPAILHAQRAQHLEELERTSEYALMLSAQFKAVIDACEKDPLSLNAKLLARAGRVLAQDCVEHLEFVCDDVRADLDKLEGEQGGKS